MRKSNNVLTDIDYIRAKELEYCKAHPDYFIETYCHIEDKDAAEIIVKFELWPMQREALLSMNKERLNIVLKSRQVGMTWVALSYAAHMLLTIQGSLVIGLSRTEDEAKELVRRLAIIYQYMPEFVDLTDRTGIRYDPKTLVLMLYFSNGKISTFKAFPSASGAARSFTANMLILDEWAFQACAREIWLSAYPTINRPTGGKVIGLSTIERGTLFEELFTENNNFNKIFLPWYADPRRDAAWYERTKKDLGPLIMQEYPATVEEALTIPGGSYFPEFKPHIHIIPFAPLTSSRKYVSLDYGLDMLAALWYEVDHIGNVVVYKELYKSGLIVSEAADALLAHNAGDKINVWYAPPDLWNRNRDTGKSTAEVFAHLGIPIVQTSNERGQGCLEIKEYLRPIEQKNEQTGEVKIGAKLQIYEGAAPNLERCLQKIQRNPKKPNEYDTDPHELTHIVDALRAFCSGRPAKTKIPEKQKPKPYDPFAEPTKRGGFFDV